MAKKPRDPNNPYDNPTPAPAPPSDYVPPDGVPRRPGEADAEYFDRVYQGQTGTAGGQGFEPTGGYTGSSAFDPMTDLEKFQAQLAGFNAERDKITGELGGELEAFSEEADRAEYSDREALAHYLSEMSGYDPLAASEYVGDYESGGEGYDAQADALGRFKALTNPEVTAEEKFLQEQSRVAEERDRRSAMDAALRDLEARGARSGGAEIAALTGAQDVTSQNRLMSDLGTQANAVNRSMRALEGYGSTASDMRGAEDRVGMFNSKLMNDYNVWKDDFSARERDAAVDRTGQTRDARDNVTNRMFGRQGALYNEKEDLAGMKLGVEGDKESGASSYTQLMLGDKAAQQAAAELKKDKSWEVGDPIFLDDLIGGLGG